VYAMLFMIITLSSIGLPGLNGFIGEFTILIGAFKAFWMKDVVFNVPISTLMVLLATSGIVLGAAYMLWLYQRVMFGELDNPENEKLKDLNLREIMTLVPIVAMCVWIGVYPKPFLRFMDAAVMNTVMIVNPDAALAEMQQMREQEARKQGLELPPGHPSVMPPGHPPIGAFHLPAGHDEMMKEFSEGSEHKEHAEHAPVHTGSDTKMEELEHSGPPVHSGGH